MFPGCRLCAREKASDRVVFAQRKYERLLLIAPLQRRADNRGNVEDRQHWCETHPGCGHAEISEVEVSNAGDRDVDVREGRVPPRVHLGAQLERREIDGGVGQRPAALREQLQIRR